MITILLTGRPCSGKTTIGVRLRDLITTHHGWKCELLDGDITRRNLWPELGFIREDRDESIRRFGYLAEILTRHNVFPILAVVSPYQVTRDRLRRDQENFLEVYVNATPELCEHRDIKGMYQKARAGTIPDFTGVSHPYEAPTNPDVVCYTDIETIDESAQKVLDALVLKVESIIETKGMTA